MSVRLNLRHPICAVFYLYPGQNDTLPQCVWAHTSFILAPIGIAWDVEQVDTLNFFTSVNARDVKLFVITS